MKKKLLLLLSIFILSLTGCAEESSNNNGVTVDPNQTPSATVNTNDEVDNAFLNEFKKYVKESDVKDSPVYSGGYSQNAETNIKSLFQNIVGRGQMPPVAGIGEVKNAEIASAMAKIIASNDATASILPYTELDVEASVFMGKVMGVFMNGTAGSELLDTLRRVRNNTNPIIYISDKLEEKISSSGAFNDNGTSNMVYLFSSFINYLNNSSSGISGIKTPYVLPDNMPFLDALAQGFYDRGEYIKDINNWNIATPDFSVMLILTNGQQIMGPTGPNMQVMQEMMAFMQTLSNIFVEYGYAESTSTGTQDEEALQTSGTDEMIFPAMILAGLDGYVKDTATQKSKNRALEFYRALVKAGGTKLTTFNPVTDALYANTTIVPVIITELKNHGVNTYDEFNQDSAAFTTNVLNIFFNSTSLTDAGTTLVTNYNNAAQNLPSAAN